jgi:hypothetical protein
VRRRTTAPLIALSLANGVDQRTTISLSHV